MSQVRFERKNMVMIVSSIDDQDEMQFYLYDDKDQSYGENALTHLSIPQIQELIQHLTACLESKNITKQ